MCLVSCCTIGAGGVWGKGQWEQRVGWGWVETSTQLLHRLSVRHPPPSCPLPLTTLVHLSWSKCSPAVEAWCVACCGAPSHARVCRGVPMPFPFPCRGPPSEVRRSSLPAALPPPRPRSLAVHRAPRPPGNRPSLLPGRQCRYPDRWSAARGGPGAACGLPRGRGAAEVWGVGPHPPHHRVRAHPADVAGPVCGLQ